MQTKKTSLKKLAIVFSVSLSGIYGVLLACGWDGYDGVFSSFTPEVFVKKSYKPLFYEPGFIFYGEEADKRSRFNETIIGDWSGYFKGKVSTDHLNALLTDENSTATVNETYTAIKSNKPVPAKVQGLNVKDPKVASFIEFLYNAKVIEGFSLRDPDSWDYDESAKPATDQIAPAIQRMEKRYNEEKDPFLKNRYWFQIIKAHFYSQHRENIIPFFEKTKSSTPENILYYRALGYLAGAYYKKKDYHKSNYLYSVAFDKCEQLRSDAGFGFRAAEDVDIKVTLGQAKTVEEKCALWSLWGYYRDEQKAIAEIYKLNPASPHLDFLLTRLVNKFEYTNENFEASGDRAFVEGIAKEGKVANLYLWNSAAGYLNIFSGDSTNAGKFLKQAEKFCPQDKSAKGQLRLLRTINLVAGIKKIDRAAENKLLPRLQEMHVKDDLRKDLALQWTENHLSQVYASVHKNAVFAEIFKHNPKYFESDANCEASKAFLLKPDKSEWEKYVASLSQVSANQISEHQAIAKALHEDLAGAIALMEKAGDGGNTELLGNPFNGKIKDCHDCDHAAYQKVKYTKLSYLTKMKEMETNVTNKVDVYNNALLLANAYYNMTFYGNARVFYGSKIGYEIYGIENQPTDCSAAKKYYNLAFAAAVNDEQKAKCTYMLAKCERNDYYTATYGSQYVYESNGVDYKAWNGFVKLKNEYPHTKYYQEVIKECGYFNDYLNKEK